MRGSAQHSSEAGDGVTDGGVIVWSEICEAEESAGARTRRCFGFAFGREKWHW
jgi:hypothetical protein